MRHNMRTTKTSVSGSLTSRPLCECHILSCEGLQCPLPSVTEAYVYSNRRTAISSKQKAKVSQDLKTASSGRVLAANVSIPTDVASASMVGKDQVSAANAR